MADFCKITSVSSLPLNISQNLAPDMSSSQKSTGKSGIRRPRKAPPVTNVINPKPVTYQVDDVSEFKLHPRAKGSFMFVNWNVLRHFVKSKKVSGLFNVNLEMAIFGFDLENEISVCDRNWELKTWNLKPRFGNPDC